MAFESRLQSVKVSNIDNKNMKADNNRLKLVLIFLNIYLCSITLTNKDASKLLKAYEVTKYKYAYNHFNSSTSLLQRLKRLKFFFK